MLEKVFFRRRRETMSKRIMAFLMSALMLLALVVPMVPMSAKAAPAEKTYDFSMLKSTMEYDLTSEVNGDNELEITFKGQYKSQFYAIPSDIDPSTITKVTFDVKSGNAGDLAFKLHTKADYESDNRAVHQYHMVTQLLFLIQKV